MLGPRSQIRRLPDAVQEVGLGALDVVAPGRQLDGRLWGRHALPERTRRREHRLDGEVILPGESGSQDFHGLRSRQGRSEASFVVFDILELDGEDLRPRPLMDRKALLSSVLTGCGEAVLVCMAVGRPLQGGFRQSRVPGAACRVPGERDGKPAPIPQSGRSGHLRGVSLG